MHDISRHKIDDRKFFLFPVPYNRSLREYLLPEQFRRIFRLVFLEKVQGYTCNNDDKNNGSIGDIPDKYGYRGGKEEDDNEEVLEMFKELEDDRPSPDMRYIIRAGTFPVGSPPARSRGRSQMNQGPETGPVPA